MSSTDCFVVSQLFSVARPARCFKPRSKRGWLYVSRMSYPRFIVILSVSEKSFTYFFLHIRYRLPEFSILEKSYCISACVALGKFLTRVLTVATQDLGFSGSARKKQFSLVYQFRSNKKFLRTSNSSLTLVGLNVLSTAIMNNHFN